MTSSVSPAPRPGSTASTLFLLVAVGLGVLATVLAFIFINQASQSGPTGPKRSIVTARRDLPVNTAIEPDRDLKEIQVPREFDTLGRITLDAGATGNYKGQRVNRDIPAGQPVFLADIGRSADYKPTPGLVAMPIQAEPGIAVPGDYVKVLVARPDAAGAVDPSRTPYVANFAARGAALRVIAVGGSMTRTRTQVLASEQANAASSSKWVTLEVTEQQAQEIQSAIGGGMQRATLVIVAPPATNPS